MDIWEYLKKLNEICDLYGAGKDCEEGDCPLVGLCGAPLGAETQGWSVKAVREFVFPPTPWTCSNCGAKDRTEGVKFCRMCGERMGG
jgi:hypothetical protein